MTETLVELVAKITADATALEKGLSDAERKTEVSSKAMAESLKKVGMAMAASGAAITAALGLMGKAAIDEDINIKRLATTINNSGTAYDSVKDSLEALIATTQRKTGIADDEQRDILGRLILITQDYGKALELLPTALDLAAAGEMDATTAATYLGKAYLELEEGADEVSVRFGQASLQFKNMEDIQNRVAGSAKNLANPLSVLKASIGDVAEEIGMNLIPLVKNATSRIVDIAIKIQEWVKEHPVLAKVLTLVSLSLGAVLTVVGGLILAIPILVAQWTAFHTIVNLATIASFAHAIALKAVTAAQWLWNIALSANPIGLVIIAIGALIAAGILLWKNWDKVSHFLADTWDNIKIAFATAIKWIVRTVLLPFITMVGLEIGGLLKGIGKVVGIFSKDVGRAIEGIADKFLHAKDTITDWADSLVDSARASKAFRDTERDIKKLTETITTEFRKQADEIKASYDKQRAESKKTYDAAVDAINKEYGIGEAAKDVSETRIEAAKRGTEEAKAAYVREIDAARNRYNTEMAEIRAVYNAKMEALNLETDATIKALQDQIDAIDARTEAEDLALQRQEEAKKLATLSGKEREEFAAEIARRELLRSRSAEKDALRERIAEARTLTEEKRKQIKKEEDAVLESHKITYEKYIEDLKVLEGQLDDNLVKELGRIEDGRVAAIGAETEKLNAEIARLGNAEKEEVKFYADQLSRANQQVKDINIAYDNLKKRYDIEIVTHEIKADTRRGITIGPFTGTDEEWERRRIKGFAQGGIVPGPAEMPQLAKVYGGEKAQTEVPGFQRGGIVPGSIGMPQLAMVHGGEAIIPNDELWGGTININIDSFTANSERDVDMLAEKIVKLIRVRTGIK